MTSAEPTGSLSEIIAETRELMRDLDDVPWPNVDVQFYMHGYDELHLALERLLEEVSREIPDVWPWPLDAVRAVPGGVRGP